MEHFDLPVRSDLAHYQFAVTLEQTSYVLDFSYNDRRKLWQMGIYDSLNEPIMLGINMQQGFNLVGNIGLAAMPPGDFVIIDETGQDNDPDVLSFGNEVKLIYGTSV